MKKKKKEKTKYSRISSLCWALKELWRQSHGFILCLAATVPLTVAGPLVDSLFSKELIKS